MYDLNKIMYNISSTTLKQNTNDVIDKAQDGLVLVNKYRKPKAVIISYQQWLVLRDSHQNKEKTSQRTALDKFKPYMRKMGETDSAKLVREMRDE